jgi:ABC-type Mn2+/Zn2+ transport system ATPase subunit
MNGLDMPTQEAILGILNDLRADGVTVLLATHDLDLAAERFDRIMLLNHRVIAFGPPADVLQSDNLLRAFGGHLHVIDVPDAKVVLADTCCDG